MELKVVLLRINIDHVTMCTTNSSLHNLVFAALLLLFPYTVIAQVGINEGNPQQALDVGGRIEVGDDIAAPSTEGSIRYNITTEDLQGYTGQGWRSLTSSGGIPSNAVLVTSRVNNLDNNSLSMALQFKDHTGSLVINTAVPEGKFLLVTHVSLSPGSLYDIDNEDPLYSVYLNFGSNQIEISGRYQGGPLYQNNGGYAPIGVVNSGSSLVITNYQLASGLEQFDSGINVFIAGFLVDDLDYD